MKRKTRYLVHPAVNEIVKFLPHMPPEKGDTVLVDGERCRVVKEPRVEWLDTRVYHDGYWVLRSPITVERL